MEDIHCICQDTSDRVKLFDFNKAFVGDEDFFNKLVNKPFDNSVNELNEDKEISVHVNNQYDPFDIDITEINGFDDLHHPEGIIKAAMENASDFFGTRATFFLLMEVHVEFYLQLPRLQI